MTRGNVLGLGIVMIRRVLAVLALAVVPFIGLSTALVPGAGAAPPQPAQDCLAGGWQTFKDASGQPFSNQGLCIDYAMHHPVSLTDLAGSFTGTFSPSFAAGCGFIGATFDAAYSGSSAVGNVTLQEDDCITGFFSSPLLGAGTFIATTSVGTVSGTDTGQLNVDYVCPPFPLCLIPTAEPVSATLTLTVTSGTGLFTGTTGTLDVNLQFPTLGLDAVDGSVTAA